MSLRPIEPSAIRVLTSLEPRRAELGDGGRAGDRAAAVLTVTATSESGAVNWPLASSVAVQLEVGSRVQQVALNWSAPRRRTRNGPRTGPSSRA